MKKRRLNYSFFSNVCLGEEYMWISWTGTVDLRRPYADLQRLYPHQIKVGARI